MNDNQRQVDWGLITALILLLVGIIAIFFPFFELDGLKFFNYEIKIDKYNELGDFIAGVTAPFISISAFILLYLTYTSQKQELKESKELLKQQNATLTLQQFETTFFNLVNLHHQITNNIDFDSTYNKDEWDEEEIVEKPIIKLSGRDCFKQLYSLYRLAYFQEEAFHKKTPTEKTTFNKELEIELIETTYSSFFSKHQSDLGHYFRNLYHIVKFIDNSSIDNKYNYTSLLRAQLSSFELALLFYNCLWDGGDNFKQYIEKYHLLKNFDIQELVVMEHASLYDNSAFKWGTSSIQ